MKTFFLLLTACSPLLTAQAGEKSITEPAAPQETQGIETRFKVETFYTFEGDFKDSSLGSQDALETNARLEWAFPLNGSWKLVAGGAYERFGFGSSLAPVPTTLQGAAGVIGLEWYRNGQRAAFISSKP